MILAAPEDEADTRVLYVGVSRAVSELIVVGPDALAARLGLAADAQPSDGLGGWSGGT